jgi:hypothetical protein
MTLSHAHALKKLDGVLSLGEEEAIGGTRDSNAEEVVKGAKIRHGELRAQPSHEALQEGRGRGGETRPLSEDEKGRIGGGGDEAELPEEGGEALVPGPQSLLQSIQGFLQTTDMIWGARVDESWRLLAVDGHLEVVVKKGVLHVQLVNGPGAGCGDAEYRPNGG